MTFIAAKAKVLNRGVPPDSFLRELVEWAKTAPDDIFAPRPGFDIYNKVSAELGPWTSLAHRKAAMLEVMRVLAGFESSWDWTEGVDTSRLGDDTPENSEAGAWQPSWNARHLGKELSDFLASYDIRNGVAFQRAMKFDRKIAMEFEARLLRNSTRHNGPLYKGDERNAIRRSLRGEEHSVFPWLSRKAVAEFEQLLA